MAVVTAEMPRASPATHRHTAAPIVPSMIFSSRDMGPMLRSRSVASCSARSARGVGGGGGGPRVGAENT